MDYHSMTRKELQALCKDHNIPANSAKSVLADKLSELLNEKQKPKTRQRACLKSPVETTDEGEPAVSRREAKKVRFSSNNDLIEYQKQSGKKQNAMVTETKVTRQSVAKKVDNDNIGQLTDDSVQIPVKLTRSRVQNKGTNVVKEPEVNHGKVTRSKVHTSVKSGGVQNNEKKRNKKPVKDVEKQSEFVEESLVGRARVTRSKAQTLMVDGMGPDVNPQVKKKSGKQLAKHVENDDPVKNVIDIPVRVTRSRRQTLKEDIKSTVTNPQTETKRTRREMKATDLRRNSSNVAPEGDKVDVVNDSRVARSKTPLPMESSGRNSKNKLKVQRKSRKEPVNRPSRKNTRQKATKMAESPTVEKKRSKGQSRNISTIDESLEDKENITVSPTSRKRKGTPIIEYQTLDSRSSTRNTSKSEEKSVAKRQVGSSLKTPVSRSGALIRDERSKKKVKLSNTEQSDSEDRAAKSNKVSKTERTPAIAESHGRATRSALRSERKEQPIGDSQLSSRKVTKFRHDPAVNTAPARVTRSGIELGGYAAGSYSEKVDKKKQKSRILEHSGDIPASESPSGTAIVMENLSSLYEENASGVESHDISDNIKMTPVAMPEVAETVPDAVSDGSHVRNQIHESGSTSKGLQTDVTVDEPLVSVKSKSEEMEAPVEPSISEGVNQIIPHDDALTSKDSPQNSSLDKHEIADNGEQYDQDENASVQKPSVSDNEPDENDIKDVMVTDRVSLTEQGELSTDENVIYGLATDRLDDEKEPTKEFDRHVEPSTCNDFHEIPILGNSECETDLMPSSAGNMPSSDGEHHALSDDEGDNSNKEHESNSKPLTENDDFNMTRQVEPITEPSSANDILGTFFSDDDVFGKNDDSINVPKELETGLEPLNRSNTLEISDSADDVDDGRINEQDGESEHAQPTSNDSPATNEVDVGGDDDSAPTQNESMPLVPEEPEQILNVALNEVPCDIVVEQTDSLTTSGNDALEESLPDINKDTVFNIFDDSGNDQKIEETSELDEGVWSKETEVVFSAMSNEQTTEEAETTTVIDYMSFDKGKQTVTTVDHDLDSGKFMEDNSNVGVDEDPTKEEISATVHTKEEQTSATVHTKEEPIIDGIDSSRLMGDMGAHESPITKESSPIPYKNEEYSDSPTSFKEDDRNKQEETRNASTPVDWGDYSFGIDEFQKPVFANESDDVADKSTKDDHVSDFQINARGSSSSEEGSRNVGDVKSNQEVDMLKENLNTDTTEEVFNWSDSSLKSLFKTSAAPSISHVKEGQSGAVDFANQDHDSSLNSLFKTPAATQISHVKGSQEDAVDFANQDNYSSLKSLFTTPATTQISHVKDGQSSAVSFTFPDDRCNEDIGTERTPAHEFNHQLENEPSDVFNGETQGNATDGPENDDYGISNFDKLFEDDGSVKNKHFDFKDDQLGQTSHDESSSGLKHNSNRSGLFSFGIEDDLAFDQGLRDTQEGATTDIDSNK